MEKIKNLILEHKEGIIDNGGKAEQQALLYPAIAKAIAQEVEQAERRLEAMVEFLNSDECSFLRRHIKKVDKPSFIPSFQSVYIEEGGNFRTEIVYDFNREEFVKDFAKNYKNETNSYISITQVVRKIIVPKYEKTTFLMERLLFSAQQYIKEVDYGVFNWIKKMIDDINNSITNTLKSQSGLLEFFKDKNATPVKVKKYIITITETEEQI